MQQQREQSLARWYGGAVYYSPRGNYHFSCYSSLWIRLLLCIRMLDGDGKMVWRMFYCLTWLMIIRTHVCRIYIHKHKTEAHPDTLLSNFVTRRNFHSMNISRLPWPSWRGHATRYHHTILSSATSLPCRYRKFTKYVSSRPVYPSGPCLPNLPRVFRRYWNVWTGYDLRVSTYKHDDERAQVHMLSYRTVKRRYSPVTYSTRPRSFRRYHCTSKNHVRRRL